MTSLSELFQKHEFEYEFVVDGRTPFIVYDIAQFSEEELVFLNSYNSEIGDNRPRLGDGKRVYGFLWPKIISDEDLLTLRLSCVEKTSPYSRIVKHVLSAKGM